MNMELDYLYVLQYQAATGAWADCLQYTGRGRTRRELFPPNIQAWLNELTISNGVAYRLILRETVVTENILMEGERNA